MIDPLEIQSLARRGEIRNWMILTPALDDASEAGHDFSDDAGFIADIRPRLEDVWFRAVDIERLASKERAPLTDPAKPAKLRSDREQNLLRVIAGLWALSSLPTEQNTVAGKVSALISTWGWDKPSAGTIADTILKVAAALPGAKIRD